MSAARMARYVLRIVLVIVPIAKTVAAQSSVKSGDFMVLTRNTLYTSVYKGVTYFEGCRLSVFSPNGSLKASLLLPDTYYEITPNSGLQTAISLDAKFAFTTASNLRSGDQERIYITRLDGSIPKVVHIRSPRTTKACVLTVAAPIAVDGPTRNGDYAIFVGRQCQEPTCGASGCICSYDVVKLRYRTSTGKMTEDAKKPYSSGNFKCNSYFVGTRHQHFETLQVIKSKLYGLLYDNLKTFKLIELGNNATLAGGSSSEFATNWQSTYVIASPTEFYGFASKEPFPSENSALYPFFVRGTKVTRAQPPPGKLYSNLNSRFVWSASMATKPLSRTAYAILEDLENKDNNMLYKFDQAQFGSPVEVAKLDPLLLLPININVSAGGYVDISQLLVIP